MAEAGFGPHTKRLSLGVAKRINMRHYVQYQVQMLAANVNYCFLVGWDIESCKVVLLAICIIGNMYYWQ